MAWAQRCCSAGSPHSVNRDERNIPGSAPRIRTGPDRYRVEPWRSATTHLVRHQNPGPINSEAGSYLPNRLVKVLGPDVIRDAARNPIGTQPILARLATLAWRQRDELELDPWSCVPRVE